jgi:segregation and condensation protein A
MTTDFRVQLDIFRGPMDLLLYLVQKHELDLTEVPIALVTGQFLEYLDVLKELDIDSVGEFVEMASTLTEMKSRLVLPTVESEDELLDDPRDELVQRLLEYKKYRDAATVLEEQGRTWQERCSRVANDLPPQNIDISEQPILEVELWDLVSAMGRILRETEQLQPSNIVYDETPMHVYMQDIHDRLVEEGRVAFSNLFSVGMHKSALIGIFLAILELIRHHNMQVEQDSVHGEIWIQASGEALGSLGLSDLENYESVTEDGEQDETGGSDQDAGEQAD